MRIARRRDVSGALYIVPDANVFLMDIAPAPEQRVNLRVQPDAVFAFNLRTGARLVG